MMIELRDKRVLVMGLGVHGGGLGVARFLVEQGAIVTVTDLRDESQLAPTLAQLAGLPIRFVLGEHRDEDFRAADIVIRNPGVPRESRFLQIARDGGAAIEMEMTLFFRLCPGPIIGITGTKGKTTTTLLASVMLREQFPDTVVAGNLRVSALEQLPQIGPDTPVVLELSSWQLEGLGEAGLSPRYAAFLNLSPDHLDRYGSMQDYAEAKAQIFLHQTHDDVLVLNTGDESSRAMAARAPGRVVWFAGPQTDDSSLFDRGATGAGWRGESLIWQDADRHESICERADVQLRGDHNLANVAAAAALAKSFGVATHNICSAIRAFSGAPDRMELVGEIDGVRYINDTTATAPAAAIAALQSVESPAIVIAGGADKRLDFKSFARALIDRAKAIVLLDGSATPKLRAALASRGAGEQERKGTARPDLPGSPAPVLPGAQVPPVIGPFDALESAVAAARELARPGDVVLLSPGCASFGMFRNEFDRGEQFRRIVREWQ
jgi:UDP-N-acetylmuramoylalanine--D-glutamate ligase